MGPRRAALEDPAEALACSLAAGGMAALAARLLELIPTGSISGDEHTAVLSGLLSELATHPELTTVERGEAARLAAVARDLPSGIGRARTVWIAWFEPSKRARELGLPDEQGRYVTSWQPSDEGDHDLYETGPGFTSLTGALDWARQRSDRVVVRPERDSGSGYFLEQATRPQTISYALLDSPVALAAWMLDHDTDAYYKIARGNLTRDNVLDKITLYWLTGASAARSYWENYRPDAALAAEQTPTERSDPRRLPHVPRRDLRSPRSWVEKAHPTLTYFHEAERVATSPRGRSRSSSPWRCEARSGRCVSPAGERQKYWQIRRRKGIEHYRRGAERQCNHRQRLRCRPREAASTSYRDCHLCGSAAD